jgi:hypothetical protein
MRLADAFDLSDRNWVAETRSRCTYFTSTHPPIHLTLRINLAFSARRPW